SGIGAKIKITANGEEQFYENHFTRGYQSSVEQILTIGIGKANKVKEVKVIWPDDKISVLQDVPANQMLVVDEKTTANGDFLAKQNLEVILKNVTQRA